jgi:hypothetical protein
MRSHSHSELRERWLERSPAVAASVSIYARGVAPVGGRETGGRESAHTGAGDTEKAQASPVPLRRSVSALNAAGRRSATVVTVRAPVVPAMTTVRSPSSARTWRQAPHGEAGGSAPVTMAIVVSSRAPAATAAATAFRSAHTDRPYEAFSTLQPTKTRPSAARTAAPTANPEYGAHAFSRTRLAAPISLATASSSTRIGAHYRRPRLADQGSGRLARARCYFRGRARTELLLELRLELGREGAERDTRGAERDTRGVEREKEGRALTDGRGEVA